jgi:YVTN family beta-propeller protein
MRRAVLLGLILVVLGAAGYAVAQISEEDGRIGPQNRIQPSGRQLNPAGRLTPLGSHPAGGGLTTNGRFYWTLSAGRGRNDVRIVRVEPDGRRRDGRGGRVVQTLPMPGLSGGIAMAPDGRTAYVSGLKESPRGDLATPPDVPGKEGDVVHVLRYDPRTGLAQRDSTIPVPPPADAPIPQDFPPRPATGPRQSWPRDIAVSPDGRTLLVALNLADRAAIVDTATRQVRYVTTGGYPYGAAITRDGAYGLVSNESPGTVSVIDLAAGTKVKDIQVGPHLSHPEGIAIDPRADRAYVAVTNQDLIAVIDTDAMEVLRTLSVARPEGIGTSPSDVSVTDDGCFLLSANAGEDALAVFALPRRHGRACRNGRAEGASAAKATAMLQHEGRRGVELSESLEEESAEVLGEGPEERAEREKRHRPARPRSRAWQLVGRVPVGSYPVAVDATPGRRSLVWIAAKGLGVGPNTEPGLPSLPQLVNGMAGVLDFPSDERLRRMTPAASRQIRPTNGRPPPRGTPIRPDGPIEHVFWIIRENRTYDQVLGDDPRGDGDPKLTLFGERITPNAHALARRFPLLDHVYANSEASIDGHFWTSAAAVSDYVVKNWHQNYADRGRPADFGVYAVTWPSQRFLFDQADKQGISWFNYGEAVAGNVPLFPDRDRGPEEQAEVDRRFARSDLGPPTGGCFSTGAFSGGVNLLTGKEIYDSSLPPGAPADAESRFDCFKKLFNAQVAAGKVPALNYLTIANDHTSGTDPGQRTPFAMVAENDWALGQIVDLISHSPIWRSSLILVVEDDSQNGIDHVDAHRIPALAISPYARRGAVVHTRYDFLSFIRTLEIVIGMKPLNLFDTLAVPMYDAFSRAPDNPEAYDVILPDVNLTERNPPSATNARLSRRLPLEHTDRTPQRYLDHILWQYVHGADSKPPPPGPNSSWLDERAWTGARPSAYAAAWRAAGKRIARHR